MEKGKLVVISGFSGVGKGTIIRRLMETEEGYGFSVSATTRYRREGEVHGKDYFFITKEEFESGIAEGRFLEYTIYSGNYYGTPLDYIESRMEMGVTIILDIETEGGLNVRKYVPEAQLIYMIPPSATELARRLINRGQETKEQIRMRLARAYEECDVAPEYDGIIMNVMIDECARELAQMIRDPSLMQEAYERNLPHIPVLRAELGELLKNWDTV